MKKSDIATWANNARKHLPSKSDLAKYLPSRRSLLSYGVAVPLAAAALTSVLYDIFKYKNPNQTSDSALVETAENRQLRTTKGSFSSTAPPKDNSDLTQYRANFEKLTKAYDAALRYDAKLEALDKAGAEREKRIEKEKALAKVKALDDLSKPTAQPQAIDSYTRKTFETAPQPSPQAVNPIPNLSRKQNPFQRFYNSVFSNRSPKVVRALPAPGFEAYNASLNTPKKDLPNAPTVQQTAPVLDAYELGKLREAQIAEAKKREFEKAHALYLANKTREMDESGIPYVGTDKVTDLKPGQRLSIPVQKISPDRTAKKTQTGMLEHYANYSTGLVDPEVGSDTSKGNLDNAENAFVRAGQHIVDAFTASSFNSERKKIGWDYSADDFQRYSKNWGKSIWATMNPNSEVYNSAGIPARIIGFPTAIVGGALELPFEILSLGSANLSDRTLEHLVLGFPDELAEGIAQTANAPGNLVTKRGFGYHLRRAYSSTLRFFKNVFTGKGFGNARNAKKAFALKGRVASLESALGTAAFGAGMAGVSFLDSGSGGFDIFNPVSPVVPPVVPGATASGGRVGRISGK